MKFMLIKTNCIWCPKFFILMNDLTTKFILVQVNCLLLPKRKKKFFLQPLQNVNVKNSYKVKHILLTNEMFDDLKIANASLELLGSLMHALSANTLLKKR